ncbi:MAG: fluoride efflux transporter CrcB [Nitrospirae bacterium]|nr:fluoride efflux transporter CrcB [Nitrospirota bacterium]
MLEKLLWIGLAGTLGTFARYGLSGAVQRVCGSAFPYGTLAVNVLGCFLFGLVWSLAEDRLSISGEVRTVILIGFMGAFTTFSSFAFETTQLLRDAQWALAAGNVLAQNVVGIAGLFLGFIAGRLL